MTNRRYIPVDNFARQLLLLLNLVFITAAVAQQPFVQSVDLLTAKPGASVLSQVS
jgi:hypothetical protein